MKLEPEYQIVFVAKRICLKRLLIFYGCLGFEHHIHVFDLGSSIRKLDPSY